MATKSFAKAQKEVLDSGFLDGIGGSRSGGITLDATAQAVVDEVSVLITEIERNLREKQAVSSGTLASTATQDISNDGGRLQIDVLLEEYYKFVDEGVNGVRQSHGSRFSFKNASPSRKMVAAIEAWLSRAGSSAQNVKRPVSKKEGIGKAFPDANSRAFGVARAIKNKGIEPTRFLTDAIKSLNQRLASSKIVDAYRVDVIESIQNFEQ